MKHETYTIRDKNGILLMRMAGKTVQDMFKKFKGEWRTYQEKDSKRTVCYELSRDSVWGYKNYDGSFEMYLWEGTKIIKD